MTAEAYRLSRVLSARGKVKEYEEVRTGEIRNHPNDLIRAHIHYVLEDYFAACG